MCTGVFIRYVNGLVYVFGGYSNGEELDYIWYSNEIPTNESYSALPLNETYSSGSSSSTNSKCSTTKTVLFYGDTFSADYAEIVVDLGYDYHVIYGDEWLSITTEQLEIYNAIIICDSDSTYHSLLDSAINTTDIWGPIITGNILILGTDEDGHPEGEPLMENGIKFVLDDTCHATGLYVSLSQYYDNVFTETKEQVLDYFGTFTVLDIDDGATCFDDIHIVARHSVLNNLDDSDLSGWGCSMHEVFVSYPINFLPLAIASNVERNGTQYFADGSFGVPYILVRGGSVSSLTCNQTVDIGSNGRYEYETLQLSTNKWHVWGNNEIYLYGACFDTVNQWECRFGDIRTTLYRINTSVAMCMIPPFTDGYGLVPFGIMKNGDWYSGLLISLFEYLNPFTESFNTVNLINTSSNIFYEPLNNMAMFFDNDTFTLEWDPNQIEADLVHIMLVEWAYIYDCNGSNSTTDNNSDDDYSILSNLTNSSCATTYTLGNYTYIGYDGDYGGYIGYVKAILGLNILNSDGQFDILNLSESLTDVVYESGFNMTFVSFVVMADNSTWMTQLSQNYNISTDRRRMVAPAIALVATFVAGETITITADYYSTKHLSESAASKMTAITPYHQVPVTFFQNLGIKSLGFIKSAAEAAGEAAETVKNMVFGSGGCMIYWGGTWLAIIRDKTGDAIVSVFDGKTDVERMLDEKMEEARNWTPCPDTNPYARAGCRLPGWKSSNTHVLHQAKKCIDHKKTGQQCCYDFDDKLCTTGRCAGTPSKTSTLARAWDDFGWYTCMRMSLSLEWNGKDIFHSAYHQLRPPSRGGGPEPICTAAAGDPHFITFDNLKLTFNGIGNYLLANHSDMMIAVALTPLSLSGIDIDIDDINEDIYDDINYIWDYTGCVSQSIDNGSVVTGIGIYDLINDVVYEFGSGDGTSGIEIFIDGAQLLIPTYNSSDDSDQSDNTLNFGDFEIYSYNYTYLNIFFSSLDISLQLTLIEMTEILFNNNNTLNYFNYVLELDSDYYSGNLTNDSTNDSTTGLSGLYGNFDGDSSNDLRTRDNQLFYNISQSNNSVIKDGSWESGDLNQLTDALILWHKYGQIWKISDDDNWMTVVGSKLNSNCTQTQDGDDDDDDDYYESFNFTFDNCNEYGGNSQDIQSIAQDICDNSYECIVDAAFTCNIDFAQNTLQFEEYVDEIILEMEIAYGIETRYPTQMPTLMQPTNQPNSLDTSTPTTIAMTDSPTKVPTPQDNNQGSSSGGDDTVTVVIVVVVVVLVIGVAVAMALMYKRGKFGQDKAKAQKATEMVAKDLEADAGGDGDGNNTSAQTNHTSDGGKTTDGGNQTFA